MKVFDEIPFWSNGVGIVNKVRDRLYRYDLKTGEARVLSPEYGQVEAFWAENGTVFFTCNIYTGKKLPQNGLYEYVEETDTVIRHLDQGMFSISYACRRNGRVEFLGSDMSGSATMKIRICMCWRTGSQTAGPLRLQREGGHVPGWEDLCKQHRRD